MSAKIIPLISFFVAEKLPLDTLDMFIKMPMYIDGLSDTTKSKLIHSEEMAKKLFRLPKSTLVSIVVKNTDILKNLPKNKVKLNVNVKFVKIGWFLK